ncbi:MAG: amidohydrolase [Pseudomonadota bacterium]
MTISNQSEHRKPIMGRGSARLASLMLASVFALSAPAQALADDVDTILHNAAIITLDPLKPRAQAIAIENGIVVATGTDNEVLARRGETTQVIDLGGRTMIPGLNDSHLHAVRGGRFYNTELRWDGISKLSEGLSMVAKQAGRTPEGQWVRVIGGWSPFQFEERRMPTPAELTAASPERPVFVLYLYSRGFLNKAGVEALGITADTKAPAGGRYEITADGGAILHAEPNPTILYQTIGALPGLSEADQVNSTRHFYRELNRFGLTSAIDAGGGGHVFPKDYVGTRVLAEAGEMPIRVSNYLFPQKPGQELGDFVQWDQNFAANVDLAHHLSHGFVVEGGGEFLTWSAGDFENWLAEQPLLPDRPGWREQLKAVTRYLVRQQWPIRIHATYDESIGHILGVFEEVDVAEKAAGRPGFAGIRWAFDHAETVSPANLKRIAALNGGIAIQARMAYAGEYFIERYGSEAAANSPPIRDIIEAGIPLGAGSDATRVASYNPWVSLHWLISGKTVGGAVTRSERHRLTREEALALYTVGSAWFSGDRARKGRLSPGQFADLAVLTQDYLSVREDEIAKIESLLTITGGRIVHGADDFANLAPDLPPVSPAWSPVVQFGGYGGK